MLSRSLALRSPRAGRLRLADTVTLVAVATVVLLVSLPRLREFALRENESDARRLIERLAEIGASSPGALEAQTIEALVRASPVLARQLDDAEFLDAGLLRRHGYLFDVARAPSGTCVVRAWPWSHGRTGTAAFVEIPGGSLSEHGNPDGLWSGPRNPPSLETPASAGWKSVSSGG